MDSYKIMDINQLVPRKHYEINDWDMIFLFRSIINEGQLNPLLINKENIIIDGNRRFFIFKFLKYKDIPCQLVDWNVEQYDLMHSHQYVPSTNEEIQRCKELLKEKGIIVYPNCYICEKKDAKTVFPFLKKEISVCFDCGKLITPTALMIGALMMKEYNDTQ